MHLRLLSCLGILLATLSGCAAMKHKKKPEEPPKPAASEAPRLVGRIASIPHDKRFVLIQAYADWNVAPGTILTTRGNEDRTANLLSTGEKLGQFTAADLQSGTVEVGDAVYSRHVPKPPEPPVTPNSAPELPQNQKNANNENVQKNN